MQRSLCQVAGGGLDSHAVLVQRQLQLSMYSPGHAKELYKSPPPTHIPPLPSLPPPIMLEPPQLDLIKLDCRGTCWERVPDCGWRLLSARPCCSDKRSVALTRIDWAIYPHVTDDNSTAFLTYTCRASLRGGPHSWVLSHLCCGTHSTVASQEVRQTRLSLL